MRSSGFGWLRSMNGVIGLCLYLALIGLIIAVAAGPMMPSGTAQAQSLTDGKPPDIQVFKAEPMVLNAADSAAVYTFKVKRAAKVQIIEAGNGIKEINNPTLATLNGTANGLPAGSIPTDASGKFITILMASNEGGSVKAELTLSLAANLMPAGLSGPTDNKTGQRTPKWLDQYSTAVSSIPTTTTHNQPNFFKCPNNCAYCLKPEEAAGLGFTQKCSDQRCYYSPDDKQSWYCYSEPVGWCCANGKVDQTTKGECTKIGGYWSTNQNEAIQACQPTGYCCLNGQVYYPATEAQCAQAGGSYWSTSQAQVMERCQPPTCWCCLKGQVYDTSQAQCSQSGGACYSTQSQAAAACRQEIPRTPTLR